MRQNDSPAKEARIGSLLLIFPMVFILAFGRIAGGAAEQETAKIPSKPGPADFVRPEGYPSVGKWMMSADLGYADWLGAKFKGRRLREPINVILIEPFAGSADEAAKKFLEECARAGFPIRAGHSGGYSAWLGDRFFPQIPAERHHALADEPFELHNNHGRFFGPFLWAGRYFFTGSLSREKLIPGSKAEHVYISFNQARDRFAQALAEKSAFKIKTFLMLGNALLDDPTTGTGDHDGVAVVLEAVR